MDFIRAFFAAAVLVFLSVSTTLFPQSPGAGLNTPGGPEVSPQATAELSAMANYRAGRDLEARSRMNEADVYYNEAVRICADEIARNRATRDSYAVMAWTLQRQRKYTEVVTWARRGERLFADDYRLQEIMGEAYFYLDDYNNSLRCMQLYVNSLPQGDRAGIAYFFVGEIYRLTQRYFLADIAYTTAVRLEPALPLWWYRLGVVREALGDFAPAVEAYERALRLNPNYREANEGASRSRRQLAG